MSKTFEGCESYKKNTPDEMIAAIEAFKRDGKVRCCHIGDRVLVETTLPAWNFSDFYYTSIPKQVTKYVVVYRRRYDDFLEAHTKLYDTKEKAQTATVNHVWEIIGFYPITITLPNKSEKIPIWGVDSSGINGIMGAV